MLITKKMLLAVTLVAALVGGGLGSLITHSAKTEAANDNYQTTANAAPSTLTAEQQEAANAAKFGSSAEQTAYREGFAEGYNSCTSAANRTLNNNVATTRYSTYRAPARRYASSSSTRRAYYDYNTAPRGRSFWSKHRDKLTMAIGTGAGAALGGLIGGKKGAGIGALAGLGGSALYTYKLRKRAPRY
jgi:hypothetical protein